MRFLLLGLLVLATLAEPATGQARADSAGAAPADTLGQAPRTLVLHRLPPGGGVRIRSVNISRPRLILVRPPATVRADSAGRPAPAYTLSPRDLQALEARLARRLDQRLAQWMALLQPPATPPTAVTTTPPPALPVPPPDQAPESLAGEPLPAAGAPPTGAPLPGGVPPPTGEITPAAVEAALLETGLFRALNVHFEVDQSTLLPASRKTLDALGEVLTRHPALRLEIGGHTDSTGPADHNLRLSQARAEAVRRYLIEQFGIAPERLTAQGYGESLPIADNATATGRTLNRRVEFRVIE